MMNIRNEQFNKLVRDKIPAWLEENGAEVETYRVESDEIFQEVLLSKLEEEAIEVSSAEEKSHLLEELGDMESVIDALLKLNGWTREDLELQQKQKDALKGTFEKRIILKSTKEKNG
jgi:predicted house-cleaning noncanonical NTP pyrophosphatase (MazG superfamily)